jgi:hypothetical protein
MTTLKCDLRKGVRLNAIGVLSLCGQCEKQQQQQHKVKEDHVKQEVNNHFIDFFFSLPLKAQKLFLKKILEDTDFLVPQEFKKVIS